MSTFRTLTMAAVAAAAASLALGARPAADAINASCPISAGEIDGKTFVQYDGHSIGLCCGGCVAKFEAWSDEKKAGFVSASLAQEDERPDAAKPVSITVKDREVKLCCKGCVKKIESEPDKYLAKVDEAIAESQTPLYPLETCIVSGEPLFFEGEFDGENVVVANRLFRTCCPMCAKELKKDPAKYFEKLDAAVVEAQAERYPLENCVVATDHELGSMGDPVQIVVANRLVQFCCKGCVPKFRKDPAKYVARVDAAWKEAHEHAREHGDDGGH
jgi:YHS domain-containing protein